MLRFWAAGCSRRPDCLVAYPAQTGYVAQYTRTKEKENLPVDSRVVTYRWAASAVVAVAAALAACYPSPTRTADEFDAVVTIFDEENNFGEYRTYAMPDTVVQRPGEGGVTRSFDELILTEIHKNMQKLGYQLEPDPENNLPDVVLVAGVVTQDEYTAWINIPWGGWWGWYGGGGSWYPPVGVRYLYTLGTIAVDMYDMSGFAGDLESLRVVWNASISGPLQRDQGNQANRIVTGIEQAFGQSPYLEPR